MTNTAKPKILMTPRYDYTDPDHLVIFNYPEYYTMIELAGGLPVLGKIFTEAEAKMAAETYDGLLITGGADINPALYLDHDVPPDNEHFDANDLLLYHAFRKRQKPILGICRGMQVIGVAEGVSLIQDIPTLTNTEHNQKNLSLGRNDTAHTVTFEQGTRLSSVFGAETLVNSFHHQALASVPASFTLAAYSKEDGVIEAIEKENVLAVQWHPERLTADAKQLAIAQLFLSDCLLR